MTDFRPTPILDALMDVQSTWTDLPDDMAREVREYAAKTHDPDTKRCYEISLNQWISFCGDHKRAFPADPDRIAAYAIALDRKGLSAFTIRNKLIAIATVHRANGWPSIYSYKVRTVMLAIMKRSSARRRRKRSITLEQLKAIYRLTRHDRNRVRAHRNWALILMGFWGALRRSELSELSVEDLEPTVEGLTYYISQSKGDPFGWGQTVGIRANPRLELCPVHALAAWLRVARITEGPVFREVTSHGTIGSLSITADAIHRIVKDYVETLGLDPQHYGAHSLRRGWATHAHKTGQSLMSIKRHLRHGSIKYTRDYIDGPGAGEHNLSQKAGA
jgi:integrase